MKRGKQKYAYVVYENRKKIGVFWTCIATGTKKEKDIKVRLGL